MKKLVLGISGGISFLISLILFLTISNTSEGIQDQQMAMRWSSDGSSAHVSCFFSANSYITEGNIIEFQHGIDSALADAAVEPGENSQARLWADAYSASGNVTISTDRATVSADAIGIGGDFFQFHPLQLLYGSYFTGNDLMSDYCIIDEDAAWQLFGSNNVAGMTVMIGQSPHIVAGVIEREEGKLAKAAGLDSTVIYVSYKTLEDYGRSNGINHYEIVMPNPLTGFAYNLISEGLGYDEANSVVVENSDRYSFLSRVKMLKEFGTRSMSSKPMIYPYWENIARGYEDILTVLTLFEIIFFLYPTITVLVCVICWWRHKTWTVAGIIRLIADKAGRFAEQMREKKGKKKGDAYEKEMV